MAQSLSEDSTRFAHYWSMVESGDSLGAADYLLSESAGGQRFEKLANFVLAWRAFESGDYGSVPVFLGLGVPEELSDHASWMRGAALDSAGQSTLAVAYWISLSADTASIYRSQALMNLAGYYRETGKLETLFRLVGEYSREFGDIADNQALDLMIAGALTDLGRHREAVERLWTVYLAYPGSESGKDAAYQLTRYEKIHGYKPREQTGAEFEAEIERMLETREYGPALKRIRDNRDQPWLTGHEDFLLFSETLCLVRMRRFREALPLLQRHTAVYPQSPYRSRALYHLARSAYLRDQDELAIMTIEALDRKYPNTASSADGLRLLGLLHQDRGRPQAAIRAYRRWLNKVSGSRDEEDALWRLGRSEWEARSYSKATGTFLRLASKGIRSNYYPVALYWASRSATAAGLTVAADSLRDELHRRFPFSYYSKLDSAYVEPERYEERDLQTIGLDVLWETGGVHTRKLVLLAAAGLSNPALGEWDAAAREIGSSTGLVWWKAQLQLRSGDRLAAWRTVYRDLGSYITTAGSRPFDFYRVVYPLDFDPQIVRLAHEYNLDPYFLFALICQESHYEETIVSAAGAIGLMQLMPETAKRQARRIGTTISTEELYQADRNLEIGIAHVAELWRDFQGDSVLVLAGYNAGKSIAQAWFEEFGHLDRDEFIENIPYRETRLFIKNIIEHAAAYRRLYPDAGTYPTASDE